MKRDLSKPLSSTYGDPVKKTKAKKTTSKGGKAIKKVSKKFQDKYFQPAIRATDSLIYNMVGKTSPMVKRRAVTKKVYPTDAQYEKALNKQAKAKQRNPKPGPYQY